MILSKSAIPISSPGDAIDMVETQICYVTFHRTITAPVRIREKNLEALAGKIDDGFCRHLRNDHVRFRRVTYSSLPTDKTSSSHRSIIAIQAGCIRHFPWVSKLVTIRVLVSLTFVSKAPGWEANARALPEMVHVGEQHQTTVNENERAAPLKRYL